MQVLLDAVTAGQDARHPVLQNFGLGLESGEQMAIIGPSGAGKTTLLHVAGLALAPLAGRVLHASRDPWNGSSRARRVARSEVMLEPQTPPLPPRQRVVTAVLAGRLAQMGLFRSVRSLFFPLDLEDVSAALARFDLEEKLFDRVDHLSGGERQRVSLARALISPARLWLLDEPLSSLDPARARQAMAVLTGAARERGITVLASFHQVDLALEFFPRVLALRGGARLFDQPSARIGAAELRELYEGDAVDGLPAPGSESAPQSGRPETLNRQREALP